MCMYGSKCYQKSRKHREAYCHDEGEANENKEKTKDDSVSQERWRTEDLMFSPISRVLLTKNLKL